MSGLNVTWLAELGDCEVEYLQKNEAGQVKHVGSVKLSNANKNALGEVLKDTEGLLIQSKMELANMSSEKFDLQTKVSKSTDQMNKLKTELDQISKQLADSKFSYAELQAENDNLKAEVKRAKASGGAAAGAGAGATATAQATAAAGKVSSGMRGLFGGGAAKGK